MDDLIAALRERYPDMDEAKASAIAEALAQRAAKPRTLTRHVADGAYDWYLDVCSAVYAAGVRDERERCEQVARSFDDGTSQEGPLAAMSIAKAIRGDRPCPPAMTRLWGGGIELSDCAECKAFAPLEPGKLFP